MRDRGIDLIAYVDLDQQLGLFKARPIQMKSARERSFGVWRKYRKIQDLIMAFVWHLDDPAKAVTYAVTCVEAEAIARELEWTSTASWNEKGTYSTNSPSVKLCQLLEPHRMSKEAWKAKITMQARK